MKFVTMTAAAIAVLLATAGCSAEDAKEHRTVQTNEEKTMAEETITYPNFQQNDHSPSLEQPGIAITIREERVQTEDSVLQRLVVHGSYGAGEDLLEKVQGEPLTWILIAAIRRDEPGMFAQRAVSPASTPIDEEPPPPPDPGVSRQVKFSWFNLDLKEHLGLPDEPGRYWLMAFFGEHVSERLEFEVAPARKIR